MKNPVRKILCPKCKKAYMVKKPGTKRTWVCVCGAKAQLYPNPGATWHIDRANNLRYYRRRAEGKEWDKFNAQVLENELAADASRRLGIPNPKNAITHTKKKFPLLGLGLIVGIGYLIWRASKQT